MDTVWTTIKVRRELLAGVRKQAEREGLSVAAWVEGTLRAALLGGIDRRAADRHLRREEESARERGVAEPDAPYEIPKIARRHWS